MKFLIQHSNYYSHSSIPLLRICILRGRSGAKSGTERQPRDSLVILSQRVV